MSKKRDEAMRARGPWIPGRGYLADAIVISMKTLDLSDEREQRDFLAALKLYGIPITS